ncbi:hypothetical protein J3R30DRAFT_3589630 [Lentinula aciculospora]|uniref:DUF6534 domain-containing protein n=1 Tax=Lentinula aciculospora TaxID=153920 RepID=A0A9W9DFA0_9AGAR|nr:hypothetical protein J3R30DRAFT_3589630 [Lentinula aciculospora]
MSRTRSNFQPPTMAPLANIEDTYGSLFLAVITEVGLMGITTMQAWIYWLRYSDRDRFPTKAVVLIVWCIEFLRSCFAVHAVYHYVVVEWGNLDALDESIWSVDINMPLTAIIQIIVHCYFAYRVRILSKNNWYIVGSIIILALANFVMTIALYAESVLAQKFSNIQGPKKLTGDFATAALSTAIAADVTITFSLLFYVSRFRSHADEKSTLPMINRLIFYLINVGIVTSVGDIAVLTLSDINTATPSLKYYALYEVVGNFYANSLLATFNTRDSLRNIHDAAAADGSLKQPNHPHQGTNIVFAVRNPVSSDPTVSSTFGPGIGLEDVGSSMRSTVAQSKFQDKNSAFSL